MLLAMQSLALEQVSLSALELPRPERAVLIERLAGSMDDEDNALSPAWASEAVRRRDEIRSGKVQAIPGDEALARVRRAITNR